MTTINVVGGGAIIEGLLLLRITQDIMSFSNLLELLGCLFPLLIRFIVAVGVVFERHLTVSILDVLLAGSLRNTKNLVEILLLGSLLGFFLSIFQLLLDVLVLRVAFFDRDKVRHSLIKLFHCDFQITAPHESLQILRVLLDTLVQCR